MSFIAMIFFLDDVDFGDDLGDFFDVIPESIFVTLFMTVGIVTLFEFLNSHYKLKFRYMIGLGIIGIGLGFLMPIYFIIGGIVFLIGLYRNGNFGKTISKMSKTISLPGTSNIIYLRNNMLEKASTYRKLPEYSLSAEYPLDRYDHKIVASIQRAGYKISNLNRRSNESISDPSIKEFSRVIEGTEFRKRYEIDQKGISKKMIRNLGFFSICISFLILYYIFVKAAFLSFVQLLTITVLIIFLVGIASFVYGQFEEKDSFAEKRNTLTPVLLVLSALFITMAIINLSLFSENRLYIRTNSQYPDFIMFSYLILSGLFFMFTQIKVGYMDKSTENWYNLSGWKNTLSMIGVTLTVPGIVILFQAIMVPNLAKRNTNAIISLAMMVIGGVLILFPHILRQKLENIDFKSDNNKPQMLLQRIMGIVALTIGIVYLVDFIGDRKLPISYDLFGFMLVILFVVFGGVLIFSTYQMRYDMEEAPTSIDDEKLEQTKKNRILMKNITFILTLIALVILFLYESRTLWSFILIGLAVILIIMSRYSPKIKIDGINITVIMWGLIRYQKSSILSGNNFGANIKIEVQGEASLYTWKPISMNMGIEFALYGNEKIAKEEIMAEEKYIYDTILDHLYVSSVDGSSETRLSQGIVAKNLHIKDNKQEYKYLNDRFPIKYENSFEDTSNKFSNSLEPSTWKPQKDDEQSGKNI